ncbi:MAG: ubiquinol-cytochrome C chaperone family protein [Pseudomonadota bacterium]|nr:ubiquinol-cytochrome C chaperone family protein [Pseudomonadota bacterium]
MGILDKSKTRKVATSLYITVVKQARQPFLYTNLGVPDTFDGRFNMISLHVFLVLRRLKSNFTRSEKTSQALFDVMFADMDQSLREIGVGDLRVGKNVKVMVANFYGRISAFEKALRDSSDVLLIEAINRNVFPKEQSVQTNSEKIAQYIHFLKLQLDKISLDTILTGKLQFDIYTVNDFEKQSSS